MVCAAAFYFKALVYEIAAVQNKKIPPFGRDACNKKDKRKFSQPLRAAAPPTISESSFVIDA
jgi:hypothetical protein